MNELDMIIDFHKDADRQGPGDDEETLRALSYIKNLNENSKIIDIGCGTGAQTMVLAANTTCKIIAIDLLPNFLKKLDAKIKEKNLGSRVQTEKMSMFELPYPNNEFDLIWAEGSIYNIGFSRGFKEWRRILKVGGFIAVTEISWITETRPEEIEQYWTRNYTEIDTIAKKLEAIKTNGYTPVAHFILPQNCWIENYYAPINSRIEAFIKKHNGKLEVSKFMEWERLEYAMYEKYKQYYSYVFYIAKKE